MPGLRPAAHHECRSTDDPSDSAIVDALAASLKTRPHERIRRTTNQQTFLLCQIKHSPAIFEMDRQRLLRVYMLAGAESSHTHFGMHGRDRQVDDQVDILVGQQLLHRLRLTAILLGLGPSDIHVEISTRNALQHIECLDTVKVDLADIPATNDPDTDSIFSFCHTLSDHRSLNTEHWILITGHRSLTPSTNGNAVRGQVQVALLHGRHHVALVAIQLHDGVFDMFCSL